MTIADGSDKERRMVEKVSGGRRTATNSFLRKHRFITHNRLSARTAFLFQ